MTFGRGSSGYGSEGSGISFFIKIILSDVVVHWVLKVYVITREKDSTFRRPWATLFASNVDARRTRVDRAERADAPLRGIEREK